MPLRKRQHNAIDRLIGHADDALRTLAGTHNELTRPTPGNSTQQSEHTHSERKHTAGLMRVNHSGEICAQALYQGQAATARLPRVRKAMELAAKEEEDHLAWCETRLNELQSHTSILNPLWYTLSFSIGATAGLAGDKWSLGFVEETEIQVCKHLSEHIQKLPKHDKRSLHILTQMHEDEAKHAKMAKRAGAAQLPRLVKKTMAFISKAMTATSYKI